MSLVDEYQRLDAGHRIYNLKEGILNDGKHMKVNLDLLVALKAEFPEAIAEIDAYIANIKTVIQNTLATY